MRAILLTSILAVLTFAGCTSPGDDDRFTTPPQDDEGRYVIEVGPSGRNVFAPNEAEVPAGATVVWINRGGFHNVAAEDGSFGNEPSTEAWEYEHTFEEPGEYGFHCEPHRSAGMAGTLRVVGASAV